MKFANDHNEKKEAEYFNKVYSRLLHNSAQLQIEPELYLRSNCETYKISGCWTGDRNKLAMKLIGLRSLRGKVVLDVGCGYGRWGILFALLGAEVYGFDISERGIEIAKLSSKISGASERTHFEVASVKRLPYDDSMFDYAFGNSALHHIIKIKDSGQEISRVLKPGGIAVFSENLGHNPIIEIPRSVIRKRKGLDEYDVMLKYEDYKRFGKFFSSMRIYEIHLLFMAKRFFGYRTGNTFIKNSLNLLKKIDDFLLYSFPFLRKYCGEAVLRYIK